MKNLSYSSLSREALLATEWKLACLEGKSAGLLYASKLVGLLTINDFGLAAAATPPRSATSFAFSFVYFTSFRILSKYDSLSSPSPPLSNSFTNSFVA